MSVLPAALFLLRSRRLGFSERERRVWRNLSFAALGFLVLLVTVRSSAAVDRLALYTIPLQVAVLSRPRSVFTSEGFGTFLVIAYAATVQFTWLSLRPSLAILGTLPVLAVRWLNPPDRWRRRWGRVMLVGDGCSAQKARSRPGR